MLRKLESEELKNYERIQTSHFTQWEKKLKMYHQQKETNTIYGPIANYNHGSILNATTDRRKYKGTPTDEQYYIMNNINTNSLRSGIVYMKTGRGKCWGAGTEIQLYQGGTKKVEAIIEGDILMGPDSTKRIVQSTTQGTGDIFKITTTKGDSFTCNGDHILVLKCSYNYKGLGGKIYKQGDIIDITVYKYLELLSKYKKAGHLFKLFKSGAIEYNNHSNNSIINPYLLGVWLGDGDSTGMTITTKDYEIVDYLNTIGDVSVYKCLDKCNRYHLLGKYNNLLREQGLYKNKHIPSEYLYSSIKDRLQLLAGLIDTDGYYDNDACRFIFSNTNENLINQVVILGLSLGFMTKKSKQLNKKSQNGNGVPSRDVSITGDINKVPTKIKRKQARVREQIKDWRNFGFTIENTGVGNYYGFTLDGDRTCLLKSFIVTHNTHIIFNLLEMFPVSTLILCHNIKVAHETKEKLLQFCSIEEQEISLITSKSHDKETKEVTITTHKNFKDNFQTFQGKFKQIIYDECDVNISFPDRKNKGNCMVSSIIMSDADIVWGLTGTPYRDNTAPDILTKLFGELIFQPDQENNGYNMIPDIIQIKHPAKPYLWSTWGELIKIMGDDEERREHQQDTIYKYHRQCSLVLFDSRAEVDTLFESLTHNAEALPTEVPHALPTEVPHALPTEVPVIIKMYGGMSIRETRESEQLLRESKNYIIVGTTDMMGRGVDIPSIDTIFMYSALKFKGTIVQAVGRCLRKSEDNKSPIVVDWCDIPLLAKQMRERTKSYKQEYGDTVSITKIKYEENNKALL